MYLSDYLDDSILVLDSNHPFPIPIIPPISMIVEISQCISMIMEIFAPVTLSGSVSWYNDMYYLYSESNRSVILTSSAIAIISS